MTIEFGYITLFAAAFPLAPLISLVYHLVEVRASPNDMFYQIPVIVIVIGRQHVIAVLFLLRCYYRMQSY